MVYCDSIPIDRTLVLGGRECTAVSLSYDMFLLLQRGGVDCESLCPCTQLLRLIDLLIRIEGLTV